MLQDEEDTTAKKIGEDKSHPRGHYIEQQDQKLRGRIPQLGTRILWLGRKERVQTTESCGCEEKEESKQQDSP